MPEYRYVIRAEVLWTLLVAALTPVLIALSQMDVDSITDYRVWAIGIGAASVRALAAALLAALGPGGFVGK